MSRPRKVDGTQGGVGGGGPPHVTGANPSPWSAADRRVFNRLLAADNLSSWPAWPASSARRVDDPGSGCRLSSEAKLLRRMLAQADLPPTLAGCSPSPSSIFERLPPAICPHAVCHAPALREPLVMGLSSGKATSSPAHSLPNSNAFPAQKTLSAVGRGTGKITIGEKK